MAPERSGAVGERSVSVAGDVVGSLIVTGDNNNVNLVLGGQNGALLEQLSRRSLPAKRLRPAPVRSVPPPFADGLDREDEVRGILDGLRARRPINLFGPLGVGKTYAILAALNAGDAVLADGAVYLYAPGPLDDVLQLVFEAWYECEPPYRPSDPQLRRDLAGVDGLVALDSVQLDREAVQQVVLAAAGLRVVFCTRERVFLDGISIALRGLPNEYAVQLLERDLGRPLSDAERDAANRVCTALGGNPLKIREAVASALDAGRSLSELAAELSTRDPDEAVSAAKLRDAGDGGRRLLTALAPFGDAAIGQEHLRAIADVDGFDDLLMGALRRRDVRAHSPRYSLGATLLGAFPEQELAPVGERALAHFTSWAEANRGHPAALMSEGAALLSLMRWAVSSGRFREAIRLGRAIDHGYALDRRFGAWEQILKLVQAAAVSAEDREAEAWALHQLGTRALCVGDLAAGSAALGEAIQLRRELGDSDGAKLSTRNIAVATRSRWLWRWIAGHSALVLVAVVLAVAAGVAAATLTGGNQTSQDQATSVGNVTQGGGSGNPATSGRGQSTGVSTSTPPPTTTPPTTTPPTTTPTTTTTTPTQTVTLTVRSQGVSVTSEPSGIDCDKECFAPFPVHNKVILSASSLAFWTNAPRCPAPPPSSIGTAGGVPQQGTGVTGQGTGASGESKVVTPSSSTTSSSTPPGQRTCEITLDAPTTVDVSPASTGNSG